MSWQSTTAGLHQKMSFLLKSTEMSDVTLIVGMEPDQRSFETHRLLLSIFSEVFQAMFYGELAERKRTVSLPDDDPETFDVFLRYIYTENIIFKDTEEAFLMLTLADKYLVTCLIKKCCDFLINSINPDSVCVIFESCKNASEDGVRNVCWKYINENPTAVLNSNNFQHAKLNTIEMILNNGMLNMNSEMSLYKAVMRWGRYQCVKEDEEMNPKNIREKVNPLLPYIRFTTMTAAEFTDFVCKEGILTEKEQLDIFKEMASPKGLLKINDVICSQTRRGLPNFEFHQYRKQNFKINSKSIHF